MITDGSTLILNILLLHLKIKKFRLYFQWIGFGSFIKKEGWLEMIRKYALGFISKGSL